ncbi:uncharacterized protein LOC114321437 [Camellia sinensis]|uniref:uncharacterized protein LOC114286161 n=1 Tax=Camellia sinensis TaxID=4442 RepID=UPI0010358577|nr:uncharacterized protein LOC114286161 [Camellia sinensis]XP_028124402.1 uncharacterized protein LOC114321437 [Camellia sinensis]
MGCLQWFNGRSLRNDFPRLFSVSMDKKGSLKFFYQRKEQDSIEDSCSWLANSSGVFSVASVWQMIKAAKRSMLNISKVQWKNSAPPKVQFFSWLACRGRINFAEFMHRIGVLNDNVSSLCVFCKAEVETPDHVLLLCLLIWNVWSVLVNWWEVKWVTPGSMLLNWWFGMEWRKKELEIQKIVPLAMLWSVWKLRNECLFKKCNADLAGLGELVKVIIALWVKANMKGVTYSVHDVVAI